MQITDVVFDFDGTCTQIPAVYENYLEQYLANFSKTVSAVSTQDWDRAKDAVRINSPKAGWNLGGCPAAPAAADPYILADESIRWVLRGRNEPLTEQAGKITGLTYTANPAPWRPEARTVFETLLKKNIGIHFVSNSGTAMIHGRLQELWAGDTLPPQITVQSDAGKFRICELPWDTDSIPAGVKSIFEAVPATYDKVNPGRPVYLRRGSYFAAICNVFNNDVSKLKSTVFCGDIWEMDLALPHALGANVHLVTRASPFDTYPYELEAMSQSGSRGKVSQDLSGILDWL